MRIRSTGLGKTELKAECAELVPKDGYLIVTLKTSQPVQWKVRAAVTPADVKHIVRLLLRRQTVAYLLRSLFSRSSKEPEKLTDF